MSLNDAAVVTIIQDKAECVPNDEQMTSHQVQGPEDPFELTSMSPSLRGSGNLLKQNPIDVSSDAGSGGKLGPQQEWKHCIGTTKKTAASKEPRNSYTPNFRRPLLSKQMTNWFYASTKSDLDEKKLILGEMISNMDAHLPQAVSPTGPACSDPVSCHYCAVDSEECRVHLGEPIRGFGYMFEADSDCEI